MKTHTKILTASVSKMLHSHSDHLCSAGEEYFQLLLWTDYPTESVPVRENNFFEKNSSGSNSIIERRTVIAS